MNDKNKRLIDWVVAIITREILGGTYGTITIHLNGGTITRTTVERSEVPDVPAASAKKNAY